ncbi:MAG: superoxide dismutase [Fimbriimonadaceae bacterium]
MQMTRRQMMAAGALGATSLATGNLGKAAKAVAGQAPNPVLLPVPEVLPEKVFTTDRVGISRRTHENHLALWQGYTRETNEVRTVLSNFDYSEANPGQIYSEFRGIKVNYAFAYGGYVNHLVYFDGIGGEGGEPNGALMDLINRSFGSFDRWVEDFRATGLSGRGWAYLAYDPISNILFNYIGDGQDTFPAWNNSLILALDVYEHAYYFDFGRNRGEYIDAFMQVIDWSAVEAKLPPEALRA